MYVAQDHYYDMFIDYVDKEGWLRKDKFRTYAEKRTFVKGGSIFDKTYKINTGTDFSYYPYIDTFSYGGDGFLSNSSNDCQYEYCNTDGSRCGDEGEYTCEHSGNSICEDDARYIERGTYRGCYIHCDYTVYCETDQYYYFESCNEIVEIGDCYYRKDDDDIVQIDGDWYRTDSEDVCYCESEGDYRLRDDCEWSEFHNEYILSDYCVWSNHHDSYIRNDEAYDVAGEYFHESVVDKVA
jgi:hypothetical protein